MKKLAVIILNYNTYKMTINVLKNIKKQKFNGSLDVIVVDNDSTNESETVLEELSSKMNFIFIKSDCNNGYAAGNNIGLKYARKLNIKYSLVMNNDIELTQEDIFQNLYEFINSNTSIGAVSPRIIGADGKSDPPIYYKKPSVWDLTFGMLKYTKRRFVIDERKNMLVYAPRGSFMLLNNRALEEINYLDESTFLYYEEPILAERLAKKGYSSWHFANNYVIHRHAGTIKNNVQKKKNLRILCKSYQHYLCNYRNMNRVTSFLCLTFRYIVASRR